MAGVEGLRVRVRDTCDLINDRCSAFGDGERKSKLGLKLILVLLHVLIVGLLFVLEPNLLIVKNHVNWYTILYLALVLITLALYLITANSSPGYVIDAMRAANEMGATFINTATLSKEWTCACCNIFQPPRSKHCHECKACIVEFDHHCVWLGTCIGQKNHCIFWWYIFAQTSICAWTVVLYFRFVRLDIIKTWWNDFFAILVIALLILIFTFLFLLLVFHSYIALTNQTTYELARRKRIFYMRHMPEKVWPFSKGICKNLFNFCCSREKRIILEPIPSVNELNARAEPYTWLDWLRCKCC